MGRDRPEPVVRHRRTTPRARARRPAARRAGTPRRSRPACATSALGTDTGCSIRLPSACCEIVGLKPRWGSIADRRRVPALPDARHRRADGAHGRGRGARRGRCSRASRLPEPRLAGLTVGLLRQPPTVGDGRETEPSDLAEGWVGRSPAARRAGRRGRDAGAVGEHVAGVQPRGARVAPGDVPLARGRVRRRLPDEARARAARRSRTRSRPRTRGRGVAPLRAGGRPLRRAVRHRASCRPRTCDELEVRLPLSAFLRWVNLIGWAGLAIGNMQLIAPHDETVLAAGLAWERG